MRVRAVNRTTGAWLFGKGRNDYMVGRRAVEQNIYTRLGSFLGDCFFDQKAGLDWFNLLGAKDQVMLTLSVKSVILNTLYVTGLRQLSQSVEPTTRRYTATFRVQTAYSTSSGTFSLDPGAVGT